MRAIAALGKSGGTLDYVAAWFIKAGEYVRDSHARIGFVATNSITQGEQVAQLWPVLFGRCKLEIAFAHRTFAWGSDARARRMCMWSSSASTGGRPRERRSGCSAIPTSTATRKRAAKRRCRLTCSTPAGLADSHLVVREEGAPINGMGRLLSGSQPIDNGEYIFDAEGRTELLEAEPDAALFLCPYVGAREYLQGGKRWILALQKADPKKLKKLPLVRQRLSAVREYRSRSKRKGTLAIADYPTRYNVEVIPTAPFSRDS